MPERMLEATMISALAAVTVASQPPRLAIADSRGHIQVSLDSGERWLSIHDCHPTGFQDVDTVAIVDNGAGVEPYTREPHQVALTWLGDTLYGACHDGPAWRWNRSSETTSPVSSHGGATLRALSARGRELLAGDSAGVIWSYSDSRISRLTAAPEVPTALAAASDGLLLAGPSALWHLGESTGSWRLLAPVSARALAVSQDAIWAGGPDGLVRIVGHSVEVHSIHPTTGVAMWNGQLLIADGARLRIVHPNRTDASGTRASGTRAFGTRAPENASQPAADAVVADRVDTRFQSRQWHRHARIAQLLPTVSVQLSYRVTDEDRELRLWLWLTWTPRNSRLVGAMP